MSAEAVDTDRVVRLGEICGVYGVRGWVKVLSFTEPRGNLLAYSPWLLERAGRLDPIELESTRETGRILIAKLAGVDDRDAALALMGTGICVPRSVFPDCAPGEYYWTDLVGLEVRSRNGESLGRVQKLIATGANDVLVLEGGADRLIPFVQGEIVLEVNLAAGFMVVDWDRSYWE